MRYVFVLCLCVVSACSVDATYPSDMNSSEPVDMNEVEDRGEPVVDMPGPDLSMDMPVDAAGDMRADMSVDMSDMSLDMPDFSAPVPCNGGKEMCEPSPLTPGKYCCPREEPSCDCPLVGGTMNSFTQSCGNICDAAPVDWTVRIDENGCEESVPGPESCF